MSVLQKPSTRMMNRYSPPINTPSFEVFHSKPWHETRPGRRQGKRDLRDQKDIRTKVNVRKITLIIILHGPYWCTAICNGALLFIQKYLVSLYSTQLPKFCTFLPCILLTTCPSFFFLGDFLCRNWIRQAGSYVKSLPVSRLLWDMESFSTL